MYKVPSMDDVRKAKGSNGLTMVSTFSGAGGSCLGFELAGYDLRWANEFVPEARQTYRANHPDVILDDRDIRKVKGSEILEAIDLGVGDLDLFEGSPPCSPFSMAGSRSTGWGKDKKYSDLKQVSDDLFFEYSRLIEEIKPKVFVAENVSGLVRGKAVGYFREILRDLRSKGYKVEAKLLSANLLGVPQARERVIFIGVRDDLGVDPYFPKPSRSSLTLGDVLLDRPEIKKTDDFYDPETGEEIGIDRFAIGNEWDRTPIGSSSTKYFQLVKPSLHKPCPTITASIGNLSTASVVHPTQKRKLTLEELRLLSSFPLDFQLTGTYKQRAERIGRSVPPLMAKAIGEAIRDGIFSKL